MKTIKTVIHLHTDYSPDSDISAADLARFARAHDVGCLAVTDHDEIEGALRVREIAPCRVIIGEEVTTRDGHLIGLFLTDWIPPGMSAQETAEEIRRQGGVVLLPHMYARVFGCGLRSVAEEMINLIDAVEVVNAQHLSTAPDRRADAFARRHGLPRYVGSDAHLPSSIGPCYQMMPPFETPDEFTDALRRATLVPGYHPWLRYTLPMYIRAARYLVGLPFPAHVGVNSKDKRRGQRQVVAAAG